MQLLWLVTANFLLLTATHAAIAQDEFLPHPQAMLHSFPGTEVYPESVTVDQATGTFFVGSVNCSVSTQID